MKSLISLFPEKFKKQQWLIIIVIAVVLIAVMDRFIFASLRKRTADFNEKIKQEERLLQQWRILDSNKDQIARDYEPYQPYYFFPESDKEAYTRFMREVERITQESGVSVISLVPRQEKVIEPSCKRYMIDLQLDVTMSQLLEFLNKINTSKLLIMVESYSVSPRFEDGRALKFEATISFLVYTPSV